MKINGLQAAKSVHPSLSTTIQVPVEKTGPPDNKGKGLQNSVNAANKNLEALKSIYSEKELKRLGLIECETCANRTYVDGSDDPNVSFKTPTKIDPKEAASAVMAHEQEHVSKEQSDARAEGREVISQNVRIHTAICPECGITYVSGGLTTTVTKKKSDYGLADEMTKGLQIDNKG